jgi:hypothetical protein
MSAGACAHQQPQLGIRDLSGGLQSEVAPSLGSRTKGLRIGLELGPMVVRTSRMPQVGKAKGRRSLEPMLWL